MGDEKNTNEKGDFNVKSNEMNRSKEGQSEHQLSQVLAWKSQKSF